MHEDITFNRQQLDKSIGVIMNIKGSTTNRLILQEEY